MAINNLYPQTSPYFTTGIVNSNFLDVMVDRPIPKLVSDRYWIITQSTFPDLECFTEPLTPLD